VIQVCVLWEQTQGPAVGPGMVAHACDPSYWEGRDWEDHGEKLLKTPSQQIIWVWWLMSLIPGSPEAVQK
jgi:hypothetical protein